MQCPIGREYGIREKVYIKNKCLLIEKCNTLFGENNNNREKVNIPESKAHF